MRGGTFVHGVCHAERPAPSFNRVAAMTSVPLWQFGARTQCHSLGYTKWLWDKTNGADAPKKPPSKIWRCPFFLSSWKCKPLRSSLAKQLILCKQGITEVHSYSSSLCSLAQKTLTIQGFLTKQIPRAHLLTPTSLYDDYHAAPLSQGHSLQQQQRCLPLLALQIGPES